MLVHNYSPYNFRTEKVHNKTALQQELGMAPILEVQEDTE